MAGRRGGGADPLADAQGARHRALLDVCGEPMLVRVVRTLRESKHVGRVVVSIGEPEALAAEPKLEGRGLEVHQSLESPSRSALDVLDRFGSDAPILVTTADHPLLSGEILDHFVTAAESSNADVLVGTVAGDVVRARYPEAVRAEFGCEPEDLRFGQRVRDPEVMDLIPVDAVLEKLDLLMGASR